MSSEPEPTQVKNCVRCGIRCRAVDKGNLSAELFVKGDMKTGRFCTNCVVVDFFINCNIGPATAMGKWYFDHTLPLPEYLEDGPEESKKRFDPACLRAPHMRKQFEAILVVGQKEYGAQLTPEEIDWDEVIANWHLPFPEKPKRSSKRKAS